MLISTQHPEEARRGEIKQRPLGARGRAGAARRLQGAVHREGAARELHGQPDRQVRDRRPRRRRRPHRPQDHRRHLRRRRPPRRRRLLGQGPLEGGPLGRLRRALRRQERRRGRPRRPLRDPGRLRDRRRPPGLGDGPDLRHRQALRRTRSPSWSPSTSTCARPPSAATSTCTARSSRRPPPTATSAARTPTSPGSGPTAPTTCARPRGSTRRPKRRLALRRQAHRLGESAAGAGWASASRAASPPWAGRPVDLLDDLLGLATPAKTKLDSSVPAVVELDVADLHHPLVDALAEVDVLDPLEPRLLDLAGDDPALDVEPAVGDRVGGRDPLDQPARTVIGDGRGDDQDAVAGARRSAYHDTPTPTASEDPPQVEAEDRPPGRVPLVDHLLPGLQVHGAQPTSSVVLGSRGVPPSGRSFGRDGDRQGRAAADDPQRPRAVRLPAAGGDGRRSRSAAMLVVPFGRRRVKGVVVDLAETSELPRRAAGRAARGAGGRGAARAGRAGPLGRRGVLLDAGARAGAGPAAGHGHRRGGPPRAPAARARGRDHRRGRATLAEGGGSGSARGRCCGRSRRARGRARLARERAGADRATLRRLEARGLVAAARSSAGGAPARRESGRSARASS